MKKTPEEMLGDGDMTPDFLDDEEKILFAEAMLGEEAIRFLDSDLGRVLRGYAEQEREAAKEELLRTPSWRKRKIDRLQQRAAVADQFLAFIREALMRGEVAHGNLKQMRNQA